MNRTMIESCEKVFSLLREKVAPSHILPGGIRKIKGEKEEGKWLTQSEMLGKKQVTRTVTTSLWKHDGRYYFVVTGSQEGVPRSPVLGYAPESKNSGFFVALVSSQAVSVKRDASGDEIADQVFGSSTEFPDYVEHDYEGMLQFFEDYSVLEVLEPVSFTDISWLTMAYILENSDAIDLSFSDDVYDVCERIFALRSNFINYSALVDMLLSSTWRHAFLDAYRCVEYFYPFIGSKDLNALSVFKGTWEELCICLYEQLSWRPKEEDQLRKIVNEHVPPAALDKAIFRSGLVVTVDTRASFTSKIYKWRNKIVHHKKSEEAEASATSETWNAYIEFLLACTYATPQSLNLQLLSLSGA